MVVFSILVLVGIILLVSIRQINEYQRGVLFTFGKYTKILEPGWRIVFPVIQSMVKVDLRVKTVDVPDQESLTKDNIPVGVNAVLYFQVKDPNKAIINVENYYYATSQLAQTTMRNAVGEVVLDKLLSDRDSISENIRVVVDKMTDDWGIKIVNVELKDIIIPENMKRTIAKEAEAERERRAVVIKAAGEVAASKDMAEAARILGSQPGALHLRTLQTVNDLSSDQSNTTVWMMPVELLRAMERIGK
jgi:regulator of protease activity HflC (stomatin/prohibitin superfamily)